MFIDDIVSFTGLDGHFGADRSTCADEIIAFTTPDLGGAILVATADVIVARASEVVRSGRLTFTEDDIVAFISVDPVVTSATWIAVYVGATQQNVVACFSTDNITTTSTKDKVVAGSSPDVIVVISSIDEVLTGSAVYIVEPDSALDFVIAFSAIYSVIT